MNLLNREELLEQELNLLNSVGPTLSSYYNYEPDRPIFVQPFQQLKQEIQVLYKLTNIKTTNRNPNSFFNIIILTLFNKSILDQQRSAQVLQKLKSIIYSEKMNLKLINNHPYKQLSNMNMKKLLVQFFQILDYNTGSIEQLLEKYSISVVILSLFFRNLLYTLQIKQALDYNQSLNVFVSTLNLLDLFDVSYQVRSKLIVFENRNTCFYIDSRMNSLYIGERVNEISTKTSDLDFGINEQNQEVQILENIIYKKDAAVFSTPTPCFREVSWQSPPQKKENNEIQEDINEDFDLPKPQTQQLDSSLRKTGSNDKVWTPPKNKVHFDSEVEADTKKFKQILENCSHSPFSPKDSCKKSEISQKSLKTHEKYGKYSQENPQKSQYCQLSCCLKKSFVSQHMIKNLHNHYEIKLPKNKIQSGVVELKITGSQFKRCKTNGPEYNKIKRSELKTNFNSNKTSSKVFRKIPQFLAYKNIQYTLPVDRSPTSILIIENYEKKPKITFTYNNANSNNHHLNLNHIHNDNRGKIEKETLQLRNFDTYNQDKKSTSFYNIQDSKFRYSTLKQTERSRKRTQVFTNSNIGHPYSYRQNNPHDWQYFAQ